MGRKYPEVQVGDVVGKLTVLRQANNARLCGNRKWECICECGKITIVDDSKLKVGHTKSCGCLRSEVTTRIKTKHGGRHTRLYAIWCDMKTRCNNSRRMRYKDYGGKGISICDEWRDFGNFRKWALSNGYRDDLTIDRIDCAKGYYPNNCRWANALTQANNTSRNIYLTYHNETHTLSEWARMLNVNYGALKKRYDMGWNIEDMFEKPYKTGSKTLQMQQSIKESAKP